MSKEAGSHGLRASRFTIVVDEVEASRASEKKN